MRAKDPSPLDVRLRRVRGTDGPAIHAAFDRLSPQSRLERFGHAIVRPDRELGWLRELDGGRHLAVCAYDGRSATPLGLARYVRTGLDAAEIAVTVLDAWQGRGVGRLLLEELCDAARAEDVRTFTAAIRRGNGRALRLFRSIGATSTGASEDELLHYAAALPRQLL